MKKHKIYWGLVILLLILSCFSRQTKEEVKRNVTSITNTTTTTIKFIDIDYPEEPDTNLWLQVIKHDLVIDNEFKDNLTEEKINKTRLHRNFSPHSLCEDCGKNKTKKTTTTTIWKFNRTDPKETTTTTTTIQKLCEFPFLKCE